MSMLFCVGSRGGAPGSSGVLGNKLLSDEHAFIPYLVTLVGRELVWGPGGRAPEVQGFWAINFCQMCMLLYPSFDTGSSRIGVGTRGGAPGSSWVLGNK